jgi:hypothetical protein
MSAQGTNAAVGRTVAIIAAIPILIVIWFLLPLFLPMYEWMNIDVQAIAQQTGKPVEQLQKELKLSVRYNPRGDGDPMPWQIITSDPQWAVVDPQAEDENRVLVRCTFLSARTGEPPGTTFINNTFKDRYYNATAIRLPPGALGQNAKRPVVIYRTLDKMDVTKAMQTMSATDQGFENDDTWEERDDGFRKPGSE